MKKTELKRYDTYKPSGLEWLGEIPAHWEIRKIKFLFKEINERSFNGEEDLLSVSQYTGVTKKSEEVNEGDFITNANTLEGYKKVSINDLVSNIMLAWNGSLGFSNYNGITSPAYSVYRLNSSNKVGYFHYLLRTDLYKAEFKRNSSGVVESRLRLYTENFFSISAILPPVSEQTAIAQFLDSKTALIDKAIELKEKQIALLKERRQATIHQAVTKGLNPDVPMKDSGIEWIGEIPTHWVVKKLKYISTTQNGISKSAQHFGFGFPFVNYGDVYKNTVIPLHVEGLVNSSVTDRHLFSVSEGDIFFTRTSESVEEIGLSSICMHTISDATFAGFLIRVRPTQGSIRKNFSKYYFRSFTHRSFFIKEINLVTRASLSQERLKQLPVLIPPIEEQDRIALALDEITKKMDNAINIKQQEIQKLKEYKANLINSAVTGKIKVA
ncbi:restriction endonuclease subunit S [Chitinophaga oryziterrae]|nr:restriction endonuclease subunit S [Chitinophaga oryziterrae]